MLVTDQVMAMYNIYNIYRNLHNTKDKIAITTPHGAASGNKIVKLTIPKL